MKKILSIAVLLISLSVSAQGNLQFNQVINLDYSATFTGFGKQNLGSVTIPAGKVWKIESATMYRDNGLYNYAPVVDANLAFDKILVKDNKSNGNVAATNYPIWISEGTYPVIMSSNNSSAYTYVCAISIIEFNVVP